jgi:6-phosphogluconolactonase
MKKIYGLLLFCISIVCPSQAQQIALFVGTYTNAGSEGIYVFQFDLKTGDCKAIDTIRGIDNPSYLAISLDKKFVYTVVENGVDKPGEVAAYSFDAKTNRTTFLNKQLTHGDHPCYVSVDSFNKFLYVGNYTGGNLSAFPIQQDGRLDSACQTIQHVGSSANFSRQKSAHVHAAVLDKTQKKLYVPDLGKDKLMVYDVDNTQSKPLSIAIDSAYEVPPGLGPRHIVMDNQNRFAYLIEELSGTIAVIDTKAKTMKEIQTISTHAENYRGVLGSADIHLTPNGKFLYASNRGDANTIALFSVDSKTGKLKSLGFESTRGIKPRNFVIDPTGQFLLVANQESNNIVFFRIGENGKLAFMNKEIKVPNPVCLVF